MNAKWDCEDCNWPNREWISRRHHVKHEEKDTTN